MTEDEAKTKWCPYARVAGQTGVAGEGDSGAYNRLQVDDQPSDFALCIASACMAWLWVEREPIQHHGAERLDRHGDCGLKRRR